jgi:hypothetical protein
MYVTATADPYTINPGGSSQLGSNVTGGTGNFTYQWTSNPPGYSSNLPNPVVSPTINTVYSCQVNDGSQTNSDTARVNVNLQSTATATPSAICIGSSSQLNAYPQGGSGIYTYSWTSNPPGFNSNIPTPVVYPTVNTDYYSSVSDGTYTAGDTVTVTVSPAPTAYSGTDTTVCNIITQFRVSGIATNQASVVWTTSGNGTFGSPNTLSTLYYPGTADHAAGTVTLTLTAYPILPCTNAISDSRIVLFDPCTGIPQNEQGFSFTLYPNPAAGQVTLTIKGTDNSQVTITITDMQGRKIFEDVVTPEQGNILKTYDISGYSKGFYLFRVVGNNLNKTEKLFIR